MKNIQALNLLFLLVSGKTDVIRKYSGESSQSFIYEDVTDYTEWDLTEASSSSYFGSGNVYPSRTRTTRLSNNRTVSGNYHYTDDYPIYGFPEGEFYQSLDLKPGYLETVLRTVQEFGYYKFFDCVCLAVAENDSESVNVGYAMPSTSLGVYNEQAPLNMKYMANFKGKGSFSGSSSKITFEGGKELFGDRLASVQSLAQTVAGAERDGEISRWANEVLANTAVGLSHVEMIGSEAELTGTLFSFPLVLALAGKFTVQNSSFSIHGSITMLKDVLQASIDLKEVAAIQVSEVGNHIAVTLETNGTSSMGFQGLDATINGYFGSTLGLYSFAGSSMELNRCSHYWPLWLVLLVACAGLIGLPGLFYVGAGLFAKISECWNRNR